MVEMQENRNAGDALLNLMAEGVSGRLKNYLAEMHPADIAEAMSRMDQDSQKLVFNLLERERAGEVLATLDGPLRQVFIRAIAEERLVEILGDIDSDDAADVIGELEEETARRVMDAMPWKEFREVRTLLRHDEETAGGIMALEIVAVDENRTAGQALDALRRKADEVEDVYNIYVVDYMGVLKGHIALKDLVLADQGVKLKDIMDEETVTIHTDMDQEDVANLFRKYDFVAAPVVDTGGRLVGRITVDDVLDVVEEEVREDMAKMAGITDEEFGHRSILKISSIRLPWLIVAFIGEIISAKIYEHFVPSINELILASFFVPMIMAMGGNIGIQSSTVMIRGLVTGDIRLQDAGKRLYQELSVAFINGLGIALLLFGVATVWFHNMAFGGVLGIALLVVLTIAAFFGTMIPLMLKRLGVDPAVATGPFITTSNDVIGLTVYFTIIHMMLR